MKSVAVAAVLVCHTVVVLFLNSVRAHGFSNQAYREQTHIVGFTAVTVCVDGVRPEQYADAEEAYCLSAKHV